MAIDTIARGLGLGVTGYIDDAAASAAAAALSAQQAADAIAAGVAATNADAVIAQQAATAAENALYATLSADALDQIGTAQEDYYNTKGGATDRINLFGFWDAVDAGSTLLPVGGAINWIHYYLGRGVDPSITSVEIKLYRRLTSDPSVNLAPPIGGGVDTLISTITGTPASFGFASGVDATLAKFSFAVPEAPVVTNLYTYVRTITMFNGTTKVAFYIGTQSSLSPAQLQRRSGGYFNTSPTTTYTNQPTSRLHDGGLGFNSTTEQLRLNAEAVEKLMDCPSIASITRDNDARLLGEISANPATPVGTLIVAGNSILSQTVNNLSTYFTGSVAGSTLTVTAFSSGSGNLTVGSRVTNKSAAGVGISIDVGTVSAQLSGTAGQTGTYTISIPQTITSALNNMRASGSSSLDTLIRLVPGQAGLNYAANGADKTAITAQLSALSATAKGYPWLVDNGSADFTALVATNVGVPAAISTSWDAMRALNTGAYPMLAYLDYSLNRLISAHSAVRYETAQLELAKATSKYCFDPMDVAISYNDGSEDDLSQLRLGAPPPSWYTGRTGEAGDGTHHGRTAARGIGFVAARMYRAILDVAPYVHGRIRGRSNNIVSYLSTDAAGTSYGFIDVLGSFDVARFIAGNSDGFLTIDKQTGEIKRGLGIATPYIREVQVAVNGGIGSTSHSARLVFMRADANTTTPLRAVRIVGNKGSVRSRGTGLVGVADGKQFFGVMCMRQRDITRGVGTILGAFSSAGAVNQVLLCTGTGVTLQAVSTTGSLGFVQTGPIINHSAFNFYFMWYDLALGIMKIRVNLQTSTASSSVTNANAAHSGYSAMNNVSSTNEEPWIDYKFKLFAPNQYLDFDIDANCELYMNSTTGLPRNIGADGSGPTGTAPAIYMHGNAANAMRQENNFGTGGNFMVPNYINRQNTGFVDIER